MAEQGFKVHNRFYPLPSRWRLGDPVLVREVTGMDWPDFVTALEQMDGNGPVDQVVMAGMLAVSFWQGNPQLSRGKVRQLVERLPQDEIEEVGFDEDDDEQEADAGPPDEAGEPSSPTSAKPTESPSASSDETTPPASGSPGSDTGSPA